MEKSSTLCHEVTFTSSAIHRKIGSIHKALCDVNPRLTYSPNLSSRERTDASKHAKGVRSHKMSIDSTSAFRSGSLFDTREDVDKVKRKIVGFEAIQQIPQEPMSPIKESGDLSNGTSLGTPSSQSSTLSFHITPPSTFHDEVNNADHSKGFSDEVKGKSSLQKSRSPNLLQSWKNVEIDLATIDPAFSKFAHLSITSLDAYKEFLFSIFGSLCAIKQIDPLIKNGPPFTRLVLDRPSHTLCNISSIFWKCRLLTQSSEQDFSIRFR